MKKNRLMTLMTSVLLVAGFTTIHAQIGEVPAPTATLTRYACLPGYLGCVPDQVTISVSANTNGLGSTTQTFGATTSLSFSSFQKYIKVNGSAYFALPTASNPTLIINSTDGIYPYTVTVSLTSTRVYTIGVARISE